MLLKPRSTSGEMVATVFAINGTRQHLPYGYGISSARIAPLFLIANGAIPAATSIGTVTLLHHMWFTGHISCNCKGKRSQCHAKGVDQAQGLKRVRN